MQTNELVLGLDIGVASVGWALVDPNRQDVVATGVRIFKPAMNPAIFEKGQPGGSYNLERRRARLQRRQTRRRAARRRDLYVALQRSGLLPFAGERAENRHCELEKLDKQLAAKWRIRIREDAPEIAEPDQTLCYYLRARALEERLEAVELGRTLYHLGQRRGFKSLRRESRKLASPGQEGGDQKEEEPSEIKRDIQNLRDELAKSGQTLGQNLALRNPHQDAIRNHDPRNGVAPLRTSRDMFRNEFERMWSTQAAYYDKVLTSKLKRRISGLMFDQRGIKAGKPGKCELEKDKDRAPRGSVLAQHFRVVQAVNNLKVQERGVPERHLNEQERKLLVEKLDTTIGTQGRGTKRRELFGMHFSEVKATLGLPSTARLNLDDEEGDSYMRGNRTLAVMLRAFGQEKWKALGEQRQRRVVRRWMRVQEAERLYEIAKQEWQVEDRKAKELAETPAEDGYFHLSHTAMMKLLPSMEAQGLPYAKAVQKDYGNMLAGREEKDRLRPVEKVLSRIPNPAVTRALTEVRRVVNNVLRAYKKPLQVRVELARSLKSNAQQRERDWRRSRLRGRERKWAEDILRSLNIRPSRDAVDRVLLHKQCGGTCVYCGDGLGGGKGSYADLFSEASGIEVEHILPRRCIDNAFGNRVLAHSKCNRAKGDQTPFQAFGGTEQWDAMLQRVQDSDDPGKLARFNIRSEEELMEFSNRHLADTRYITTRAAEYLEELYGGRDAMVPWQDRNQRRVYACAGELTDLLRRTWGLERILRQPEPSPNGRSRGKARSDYRHHAIDAIIVAYASERVVQQVSTAWVRHDRRVTGHTDPRYLPPPWPPTGDIEDRVKLFAARVEQAISTINVSHRPERTLQGSLHDDTLYSRPRGPKGDTHVRIPVRKAAAAPQRIVDAAVRRAVEAQLAQLGGNADQLDSEPPILITRTGKKVPIRRVRVVTSMKPRRIGAGAAERYVTTRPKHHVALFVGPNKRGQPTFHPIVVSRFDAMQRKQNAEPIVQRSYPNQDGYRFAFALMNGDMIEMEDPAGSGRTLFVMRGISESSNDEFELDFVRHTEARRIDDIKGTAARLRIRSDKNFKHFFDSNPRKVEVDPLGRVHYVGAGGPAQPRRAVAD